MSIVTSVDAVLSAQTSKFDAGLNKAKAGLNSFSSAAQSTSASIGNSINRMIGNAVALAGTYLGLRASLNAFNDSAERLDKMGPVADTLGLTIAEMQAFTRTGELANVEVEGLTKALGFFERQIGATQIGTEAMRDSAKQVFRNIGVDIDALAGKSVSEKFIVVAEALNAMSSNEERLAAGAKLFGRNIVEIMPALEDVRKNIQESKDFAEEFGIALTRQDVSAVERMNDTWDDVRRVIGGTIDRITVGLAPALIVVAEQFLGAAAAANSFGGPLDNITGRAGEMTALASAVFYVSQTFGMLAGTFELAAGAIGYLIAGITRFWAFVTDDDQLDEFGKAMLKGSDDLIKKGGDRFANFFSGKAHEDFKNRLAEVSKEIDEAQKKNKPTNWELIDFDQEKEKIEAVTGMAQTARRDFSIHSAQSTANLAPSALERGGAIPGGQAASMRNAVQDLLNGMVDKMHAISDAELNELRTTNVTLKSQLRLTQFIVDNSPGSEI